MMRKHPLFRVLATLRLAACAAVLGRSRAAYKDDQKCPLEPFLSKGPMTPSKVHRYCVVETCKNNSRLCPTKIFLTTKSSWYPIIGREELSKNSCFFICEDHFNLKDDAANWFAYSNFSRNLRLKKGVVPHLFLDTQSTVPLDYSQLSPRSREKRRQMLNQIDNAKAKSIRMATEECSNREPAFLQPELVEEMRTDKEIELVKPDSLEDPLKLDSPTTKDTDAMDTMDVSYILTQTNDESRTNNMETVNDEEMEDMKPDFQELDTKMTDGILDLPRQSENLETFLKYLGTKLEKIDEGRLRDKAERDILGVVQKYIDKIGDRKDLEGCTSRLSITSRKNYILKIIRDDHDYGKVSWWTE